MITPSDLSETDKATIKTLQSIFNKIPGGLIETRYCKAIEQARELYPTLQYRED